MRSSALHSPMAGNMIVSGSQFPSGHGITRNKVLGGRLPGMICRLSRCNSVTRSGACRPMNRCMLQHHLQQARNARTLEVILVSSTSSHAVKQVRQNRLSTGEDCCLLEHRWLLQHSCNLLAPQMLLWCLKNGKRHVILLKQGCRHCRLGDTTVTLFVQVDLPVDPGVVLLDIAFTGNDANHGVLSSISISLSHTRKQTACNVRAFTIHAKC